ncbi:MAG: hypothetical protein ACR2RA_24615 [Geminicoccaceae bacterium]
MDVSIKAGLSIVAICAGLSGCAGLTDPSVGQGPIALSAEAEQAFADYQAKAKPRYFAVSADGSAFYYSFCDVERCLRQVKTKVIQKCETYSNGVPCKIYGSHGKVVWFEES